MIFCKSVTIGLSRNCPVSTNDNILSKEKLFISFLNYQMICEVNTTFINRIGRKEHWYRFYTPSLTSFYYGNNFNPDNSHLIVRNILIAGRLHHEKVPTFQISKE